MELSLIEEFIIIPFNKRGAGHDGIHRLNVRVQHDFDTTDVVVVVVEAWRASSSDTVKRSCEVDIVAVIICCTLLNCKSVDSRIDQALLNNMACSSLELGIFGQMA